MNEGNNWGGTERVTTGLYFIFCYELATKCYGLDLVFLLQER